jgi:tetratricopeptide (TPR) repeat protein
MKKYRMALLDTYKIISLKPESVSAYSNRGFLYYKLGMYQKSLKDYAKALSLNPKYAGAYYTGGLHILP